MTRECSVKLEETKWNEEIVSENENVSRMLLRSHTLLTDASVRSSIHPFVQRSSGSSTICTALSTERRTYADINGTPVKMVVQE